MARGYVKWGSTWLLTSLDLDKRRKRRQLNRDVSTVWKENLLLLIDFQIRASISGTSRRYCINNVRAVHTIVPTSPNFEGVCRLSGRGCRTPWQSVSSPCGDSSTLRRKSLNIQWKLRLLEENLPQQRTAFPVLSLSPLTACSAQTGMRVKETLRNLSGFKLKSRSSIIISIILPLFLQCLKC